MFGLIQSTLSIRCGPEKMVELWRVYTRSESLWCCVETARRLPGGPHSAQPRHLSLLHNLLQGFVFALFAHMGLQVDGFGAAVVVAVHGGHPAQQSHEHLNDQLSKLCAQNDSHPPTCGVVVVASVVVVAGTGVGAGVGACGGKVGLGVGSVTGVGAGEGFGVGAGFCGTAPLGPNCDPMCLWNSGGQVTARYFTTLGSPRFQPQEAKSLQPFWNAGGSWSHRSAHWAVSWHFVYQSPSTALCCWLSNPVFGRLLQTLAVEYCKLSKPGAATSKCGCPAPQPWECGGHRFFFITTAVQSG